MRRDRKWLSAASVGAPAALVVYFSFNNGGFFPGSPALVAIVLAFVLVLRLTLAHNPLEGISVAGTVAVGAFALLTGWTLISGLWSDAPGRALLEYDRALLYTLTVVVFATLPRRSEDLAWVVRLLAVGIVAVCAAGLTTRLAPDVWSVPPSAATDRLSYPLTYWNALGVLGAIGVVLLVHLATAVREPRAVRVLAAAASPIVVATIFYTFSRGAIAAGALGIVVLLAVARPAGWPTGLAAIVPACAGVLLVAVNADLLASDKFDTAAGIDEGHRLVLVVALGALVAGGLRAALLRVDDRLETRRSNRPRRTTALAWGLTAAVLAIAVVAAGGPGFAERQYDRFVSGDVTPEADQRARLLNPGNNGRLDHWSVALARFRADPLRGDGAGTYQIAWDRDRSSTLDVVDAHSLYLELLSELGFPGLALLVVGLGTLLGGLARLVPGPERGPAAALLAAGVVWAVHAGIDWDWEMPATGDLAVRRRRLGAGRPGGIRAPAAAAQARADRDGRGLPRADARAVQRRALAGGAHAGLPRVRGRRLPAHDRPRTGVAGRQPAATAAVRAARLLRRASRLRRARAEEPRRGRRPRSQLVGGLVRDRARARRAGARSASRRAPGGRAQPARAAHAAGARGVRLFRPGRVAPPRPRAPAPVPVSYDQ